MAKNVNYITHKKSSLKNQDGSPKLPSPSTLVEGEIAVNFAKDVETLSIKNESGSVVTFSSDEYFKKKNIDQVIDATTSSSTKSVSTSAVYNFTTPHMTNGDIHVTTSDKAKWNNVDNKQDISGMTAYTTTAITNTLSGTVTAHTANTTVHVTSSDKNTWNNKLSATDSRESQISLSSVSGTNNSNITLTRSGYATLSGNNGVNISVGNGKEIDLSGKVQVRTSLYVSGIYSNKDVKTAINEIHNNLDAVDKRSTTNKSNIETLSGNVTTINNNITTINNNIDTINGNINTINGNITSVSGDVEALSGDVETLSDSVNYISNPTKFYNFEDAEKYPEGTVFQASTTDKITINRIDCYAVETPTDAVGIFLQNASNFNINNNELLNFGGGNRWLAFNDLTSGNHLRMVADARSLDQGHTSVVSEVVGLTLLSQDNTNGIETFIYEITSNTVGINFYRYSKIRSITEYDDDTMRFKTDGLNILKDEITEDLSGYYKKTETSGATEISNALGTKVNSATFTAHTASTVHMDTTEKTNLDSLATNIGAISGITSSKINAWDAASTSAHTHTNKAALDSIKGVSTSIANSDNLITSKAVYSGVGVTIEYDSTSKYIQLKSTSGNVLSSFDATAFIKDGMVSNVEIKDITSGGSQVTCLVITFNTDAGKDAINIPISDIFDASNYYNKTEIDDLVGSGFTSSSITDVIIENEEIISNALTNLDDRKLDASAYTPTDLSNYYTKSETSGSTELSTAFSNKADSSALTAHTANTNIHLTTTEKGQLHTHTNKTYLDGITGTVGTMVYENASSYSSATQVSTALADKVDNTEYATFSAATNTSIEDLSGQSETIAAALNVLNGEIDDINNTIGDIETLLAAI